MKIRPLHDRILVQRVEEETTTKGGIIIPDTAKEKPAEGKVIAVGKGRSEKTAKRFRLILKKVIKFCSANMPEQRLRSKARNILLCGKMTFLELLNK